MGRCQDKDRDIKNLKNQYDLVTNELKYFQIINEYLEKSQVAQVKKMSNKPPDEHEVALQEFVVNGFDRTKHASIIYGVRRNKEDGISFSQNTSNQRVETWVKPMEPSCSSSTKRGLYSHHVPVDDKAKVLNQSELKTVDSKVLNNS